MALNENEIKAIKTIGTFIGKQLVKAGVTYAVSKTLQSLLVSHYEKKTVSGNKIVVPTQEEIILESNEVKGSCTESSLANDEVAAQKGALDAAKTDAQAATTEATAMDTGASALKTKAGATDIATKALKIN